MLINSALTIVTYVLLQGFGCYCADKKLPHRTLEYVKDVKVHTTYFLLSSTKHMLKLKDRCPNIEVLSWDIHLYNMQLSTVLTY
jgi:hypothetical protein